MKLYLAAPLFSQMERSWNRGFAAALAAALPGAAVLLPQDFRSGDKYNDPKHYGALYKLCLAGIDGCDAVVAVLDGADVDSGVAFEVGYARARGKPVVGLRTDYRPGADHGVNLMCCRSCRYVVREFAFQEDPAAVAKSVARRLSRLGPPGKKGKSGGTAKDA